MTVKHKPGKVDGFISGWIGGAASTVVAHPLDTIKVRLQIFPSYNGVIDCCRKTFVREGVKGFYRGMLFPLVSASMYNSLVFGSFQLFQEVICKLRYHDHHHKPAFLDQCMAALGSGGLSVILGSPVDLIKIRLQIQTGGKKISIPKPRNIATYHQGMVTSIRCLDSSPSKSTGPTPMIHYRGPLDCAAGIYGKHGLRGLYHGSGVMIIRDIPGYTIYLVPYCMMREYMSKNYSDSGINGFLAAATAGGFAGVLSWGFIHPLDTVKSRIQADIGNNNRKYNGFMHCVRCIYYEDGYPAFFRGITVNALRGFPQSAALFAGVELTTQMLKKAQSFD